MEQQAFPGGAVGKSHVQSGDGRMDRLHIAAQGPADNLPGLPGFDL
jgi:hypothetical protein